jgi:hypothetical protein
MRAAQIRSAGATFVAEQPMRNKRIRCPYLIAGVAFLSVAASGARAPAAAVQDRCKLLTAAEVTAAIGTHNGGTNDLDNEFGLMSCRWRATTAQQVEGYPDGWFDSIEVAVFDQMADQWARQQASGDPVSGFVPGALYDQTWGRLWFNCARNRFCVVTVRTAKGDQRAEIANRLAKLVETRLR